MPVMADHRREAEARLTALADTAARIQTQLDRNRRSRRGVAALLVQFERQRMDLRQMMSRHERQTRRDPGAPAPARQEAEDRRFFKRLRKSLRLMIHVQEALQQVHRGAQRPLYPPLPSRRDVLRSRHDVMDATLMALHHMINPAPQSDAAEALGCFPDIPLGSADFTAHAHAAYRVALAQHRRAPRFLDVGCGGGMKMLLASAFFDRAEGLDFDPAYVRAAQTAFSRMQVTRCRAFEANALTFEGYADYEVIYFFQPMSDNDGLCALEDRILAKARPGTILIAPYQKFLRRWPGLDCSQIEDAVYVTGIDAAAAAALHREARRIGPEVLSPDRGLSSHCPDWLAALWLCAARNGYLPDSRDFRL